MLFCNDAMVAIATTHAGGSRAIPNFLRTTSRQYIHDHLYQICPHPACFGKVMPKHRSCPVFQI